MHFLSVDCTNGPHHRPDSCTLPVPTIYHPCRRLVNGLSTGAGTQFDWKSPPAAVQWQRSWRAWVAYGSMGSGLIRSRTEDQRPTENDFRFLVQSPRNLMVPGLTASPRRNHDFHFNHISNEKAMYPPLLEHP